MDKAISREHNFSAGLWSVGSHDFCEDWTGASGEVYAKAVCCTGDLGEVNRILHTEGGR